MREQAPWLSGTQAPHCVWEETEVQMCHELSILVSHPNWVQGAKSELRNLIFPLCPQGEVATSVGLLSKKGIDTGIHSIV